MTDKEAKVIEVLEDAVERLTRISAMAIDACNDRPDIEDAILDSARFINRVQIYLNALKGYADNGQIPDYRYNVSRHLLRGC